MRSPLTDRKNVIFLWVHVCNSESDKRTKKIIFLWGLTHEKIIFNLGERNFSVRVRPTEKLFLTVNPQKNLIFLSFYFCVLFSNGTPSEKYFSVGIWFFPWVFAHTEIFEFPVVEEDSVPWLPSVRAPAEKKRDSSSDITNRPLSESSKDGCSATA